MRSLKNVPFFLFITNLALGQAPCFDDCWRRMESSASPFAALEMLKELEGCQAPEFTVRSIDDEEISLKSLTNSVVVINFWFIGCTPCIEEMPRLNKIVDLYRDKGVVFLSFARDSKEDIEKRFLPKHEFKYKIMAGKYNISKLYCVVPYPVNIVIGKTGKIELALFDSVAKDINYSALTSAIDNALLRQ